MSKIFDAYKKRSGGTPDLAFELTRSGEIALFPTPSSQQLLEFNELANMLLRLRRLDRGTTLGFASTVSGEGASYVSFHAAQQLAHSLKQRVVWIDGNFKSPQRRLQPDQDHSFASLLQDPNRVRDLNTSEELILVPGGTQLVRHTGIFASEVYPTLLQSLAERFDFTIIDMPPILESVETALMSAGTDGLLVVIESKRLKREVIKHGIDSLQEKQAVVLGTVINRREYDLPKIIYDRL
jgi:receptor protein-tyrosine kinase